MSELLSPGLEASSQAPPPLEVSKEALPSLSLENSHQILPEENCLQVIFDALSEPTYCRFRKFRVLLYNHFLILKESSFEVHETMLN